MASRSTAAQGGTPVRIGLIGYGLAGSAFHAPLIVVTPGLDLAVIVTGNPERRQQAERDHPRALIVESVEWLWAHAHDLDVVVVATPNRTHVPLSLAALDAGLHVVVDKPLAPTAHEGQQLVHEARRRDRILVPFQNRRWDGDFRTAQRLLREGALGDPSRFESRFERWRPAPKTGWRELGDPAEAGGLLFDLGSHLIDQALTLFGPVQQVYAELDRRRPGVEVDDDAFVAMSHHSGVRSHLWMSAVAAQPGPRMRILGSRAAYTKFGLDVQEKALRAGERPGAGWGEDPRDHWGHLSNGTEEHAVPTERGAYQDFYARLVATIRLGAPPPVDADDAVATLRVIEAARESAVGKKLVSL
ncbi:MAG: Gfo/Idh/MocA family oxidoreductase [Gemmatimonadaceae bacterium]